MNAAHTLHVEHAPPSASAQLEPEQPRHALQRRRHSSAAADEHSTERGNGGAPGGNGDNGGAGGSAGGAGGDGVMQMNGRRCDSHERSSHSLGTLCLSPIMQSSPSAVDPGLKPLFGSPQQPPALDVHAARHDGHDAPLEPPQWLYAPLTLGAKYEPSTHRHLPSCSMSDAPSHTPSKPPICSANPASDANASTSACTAADETITSVVFTDSQYERACA